jgi:Tol biopolymer transport system component
LRPLALRAAPAVSADGREVVFWRDTGQQDLFIVSIDGGDERRILTRGELVRAPTWSPDGEAIAFSHVVGQKRCRVPAYGYCLPDMFPYNRMYPLETSNIWGLARVDRNGGSYQDLAVQPSAVAPNWTDRGIFYGSSAGLQVTQDGSDGGPNRMVLGQYRYQDPAGQPHGDRVVFHSLEKDHWEIFTANADGSGLTALTRPDALDARLPHNVSPAWSPDGRSIVFLSNRTGQWRLWVMNADGSNQRLLPVDVPIEYNYQGEQVVSWGK